MPDRAIIVTLPEVLYERVKITAEASARSMEDVCTQSIALSLPELEGDLAVEVRSELATFSLLSDTELENIAHGLMSEENQVQLEMLAEVQKQRVLTAAEKAILTQLLEEAQRFMLRKAEAYRLLARRGHTVFSSASTSVV